MLVEAAATGLFGLTLEEIAKSVGKTAFEWGTKKLLDTIVRCPNCERAFFKKKLPNHMDNSFVCHSCRAEVRGQHVNATRHTVRRDNTLVSAQAGNLRWVTKRSFWKSTIVGYYPILDVQTSNSRDNDLVVQLSLLPRDRRKRSTREVILAPRANAATFRSITLPIAIPASDLPKPEHGLILDVDIRNSYGEKLQNTVSRILSFENEEWTVGAR